MQLALSFTKLDVREASTERNFLKQMSSDSSGSSSSYSESHSPNPDSPLVLLGEYCPFIADVPISSFAEPFPITNPDTRSDDEIEKVKKLLQKVIHAKKFDAPLPLADFCLIAKERWDDEESDSEASTACLLL
jgi:hypothetical protein